MVQLISRLAKGRSPCIKCNIQASHSVNRPVFAASLGSRCNFNSISRNHTINVKLANKTLDQRFRSWGRNEPSNRIIFEHLMRLRPRFAQSIRQYSAGKELKVNQEDIMQELEVTDSEIESLLGIVYKNTKKKDNFEKSAIKKGEGKKKKKEDSGTSISDMLEQIETEFLTKIEKDDQIILEKQDSENYTDFDNGVELDRGNKKETSRKQKKMTMNETKEVDFDQVNVELAEYVDSRGLDTGKSVRTGDFLKKGEEVAGKLSESVFNHVILQNAFVGRIDEAKEAYNLMISSGIAPTSRTLDHMMLAYAKKGDLEGTVEVFKEYKERNLEYTQYSYSAIIKAYVLNQRLDDAYKMYEMMKREKCMPDETVYNQLLLGCIKYEDYKRAWGTFEHMRYEIAQIGVKTMTIMINLCTIEDKVEKALGLVDEMILNKQPITDVTFNSLINACAHRKGYFDEAFSLLAKMEMAGFKPDYYTYNTLLYACAKNKNLEMARLIFNKITESKDKDMMRLDASSFTNLFYVYSSHLRATNTLTRKQAIERMVEKGESIRVVSPQDLAELNTKPQTKPSSILGMFEQLSREHDDETIQHPLVNDTGSNPGKKALDLVKRTEPTQLIRAEVSPPSFNQIVPVDHSSVLEEAKQIYSFYLSIANTLPSSVDYKINSRELVSQSNTKKATRRVLNAYLSILVNCGDFDNAWNFYCLEYDRLGCKRDGFTLEIALNLANATRDVNMAWIVWSQFREWRLLVEKAIQPQKDLDAFVKLKSFESIDSELDSKFTAIGRILNRQSKAAQTNTVDIKKWFALPSANSKISYSVRESIRSSLGCNKTQEYQVYRQMILLLARNDHLRTSLRLLYDLKHNIIDHSFASFNINDFKTIYVRAAQLGDLRAKSKFLKLCKPDQRESLIAENKKYLNFKWGTKNKGFYIGPKNAEDMISQYEEDIEGEAASTQ